MVFSMKKSIILICILILFLPVTAVAGEGFFGPDTVECNKFSIELPEGYSTTDAYDPHAESGFHITSSHGGKDNNTVTYLYMNEVSSFDDYNRSQTEQIIENYTDGDIKAQKCYDPEKEVYVDVNPVLGYNSTHIEFDKDGHHFIIIHEFQGKYEDIDLKKDVDLAKQIKKSLKIK